MLNVMLVEPLRCADCASFGTQRRLEIFQGGGTKQETSAAAATSPGDKSIRMRIEYEYLQRST